MNIKTLADLNALAAGSVVLDGRNGAWQSCVYTPDTWYAPGCEIERTAAQMLEIGPLRTIYTPATPVRATAYERYRPIVDPDTGRPALVCDDCRDSEGWPGVRVWTVPEQSAVDLADQIAAADEHERANHLTGCRHEPYDCNCDDEED